MAFRADLEAHPPRVLRVGELLAELRDDLQAEWSAVWVVGEVSNLRRPTSGHLYFTLKDHDAQLRCVLFRRDAARVLFELEDGLEVLAFGGMSLYEARGDLQLIIRQVEPRGRGALQLAYEQLRARLEREGLFALERKRPLPPAPRCVGLVTSAHGAALRDVLRVARERAPALRVILAASRVQGEGAEGEIVAALQDLTAHGAAEIILLVRGGGSLEDLWPFNTEIVARALARCPIPVVTGVGHATDLSIADLAADAHASTPSAAASLVFPDRALWSERAARLERQLASAIEHRLGGARHRVAASIRALGRVSPAAQLDARRQRLGRALRALATAARARISERQAALRMPVASLARMPAGLDPAPRRARVAGLRRALEVAFQRELAQGRSRLAVAASTLDSLSPLAVLGRGYAIAQRRADGAVIRSPADVTAGQLVDVRVRDGAFAARVTASDDTQRDG